MDNSLGTFLGVEIRRPKVGFFELSSCEGCQLQLLNNEATLLDFLGLMEIVNFREAMTEKNENYDLAFVEGSVTRDDEISRLKKIRSQAKLVIALGSCACFGGVNQLKNQFHDLDWVKSQVYGDYPIDSRAAAPLADFITIDLEIYGCPIKKEEVERLLTRLVLGKEINHPNFPVCMECKRHENICLFDLGEPCLGPITRAGCDAWCPSNVMGCWGCRGAAPAANFDEFISITQKRGIPLARVTDRLACFGGFEQQLATIKNKGGDNES